MMRPYASLFCAAAGVLVGAFLLDSVMRPVAAAPPPPTVQTVGPYTGVFVGDRQYAGVYHDAENAAAVLAVGHSAGRSGPSFAIIARANGQVVFQVPLDGGGAKDVPVGRLLQLLKD